MREHAWSYVLVAVIALGVGAGGAVLAMRFPNLFSRAAHDDTQATATTGADMAGMDMAAPAPDAAHANMVYIPPARQQLIGVRTAEVVHRDLDTTIRTVGTLAYNETGVTMVHTKVAGWVDKVFVDYVGKTVRRGEPLFTVYSPELVSTEKEYLLALKAQQQLGRSRFAETREGAASLVDATRERLRLWDISDAQIADIERTGEPKRTLSFYSPFDGVVLERSAFAGQYITPETDTFKIANLSTVWAIGQVFEYELALVKLGQPVQIEFPYARTTRTLRGRLTYIYPDIDPMTRRAKIRAEFPNPGFEFKPESYVTVVMHASGGMQLAIPKEAVIDTGTKRYTLLAHPDGYFEPREIEVGEPVDDYYPVLKGLQHGDTVVTSAQFLVDSESNLKAAMQAMMMSMPGMDMGGADHSKHQQ